MKKFALLFLSVGAASMILASCSSTETTEITTPAPVATDSGTPVLTVNFPTGSASASSVNHSYRTALQNLATTAKSTGQTVKIVGYTSDTGSESLNQALAQERANTIRTLLVRDGVPGSQIRTIGAASTNPVKVCPGGLTGVQLENCLAPNRRADIYLLP